MRRLDTSAVSIQFRDRDNTLVRYRNVLVQVRVGVMNEVTLTQVASVARAMRLKVTGPVGYLAVIEKSAQLSAPEVRSAQRKVISELLNDERSFACGFSADDSVGGRLLQTVTRLFAVGNRRFALAKDAPSAARWLADKLGSPPADELVALIEHTRALARQDDADR